MKKVTLLGVLFLFFFAGISVTYAADFSDLNNNGLEDESEVEVIVDSNKTLPAGNYLFGNLTLTNNATIIAEGDASSSNVFKGVKITAVNLTINSGSSINADGQGYGSDGPGSPLSVSVGVYPGGSYGGVGGLNTSTSTYGSLTKPVDMGSGGYGNSRGGGAVNLVVIDTFTNNGSVFSNGIKSSNSIGAGSGGSIYVIAKNIVGSGRFFTNGGNSSNNKGAGAGGGGRIAIYYNNTSFSGSVKASGGIYMNWGTFSYAGGGNGTVVFEQLQPTNIAPTLTNPTDPEYKDDGINPNKGVANKDLLTFKTIYTDTENATPTNMDVVIRNTVDFNSEAYKEQFDLKNIMIVDGKITVASGASFYVPLKRENIYLASTTIVVDSLSPNPAGETFAIVSLQALNFFNNVIVEKELTIPVNSNETVIKTLAVTATSSISTLRVVVKRTNNTQVDVNTFDLGEKLPMVVDTAVVSTALKNAKYSDGEQYTVSSVFPKGKYTFHFETTNSSLTTSTASHDFTTGYNNVAFLPGIKASRLFKQKESCLFNCEDQLWEPDWWTDTNDIRLSPSSTSDNKDIYTKTDPFLGTIDQANIIPPLWGATDGVRENFYWSFINSMNKMVKEKEIAEWKALPYDWRLSFADILSNGIAIDGKLYYDDSYGTETKYILSNLRLLAKTSDSGKITIVAHSMGGLLAKKLLIENSDIASSTDTLIMVDSPQLGTPQAIATMLHGTKEDLPESFGLFTDAQTGRRVAQNMPSVYTLLPSKAYTERVIDEGKDYTTIISKDSTLNNPMYDDLFNERGGIISGYNELSNFLVTQHGYDPVPDNNVLYPTTIRPDLLSQAQAIHDVIDNWVPPNTMRVVQIAGWGIPDTIRGVEYKAYSTAKECSSTPATGSDTSCGFDWHYDMTPIFTFDGDGTVVVPSQTAMSTETYWVDLNGYNNKHIDRKHGSILEVEDARTLIENIFENKVDIVQGLIYVKTDKNQLQMNDHKDLVRLSLHSPVNVDIYDSTGNHIGISASSTETQTFYDTQMPNSYYLNFGEGKYLGFQLEASTTIQLQGTGSGTFTLNMDQYQGDTKEGSQTFTDIPVSTTTKATFVINTLNDAKELALDQNGDGTIDSVVFTDENKQTVTFQTLKDEIQKLLPNVRPSFLNQTATAEKQFNKGNNKATKALLLVLKKEVEKLSSKKNTSIQQTDTLRVLTVINTLVEKIN
jgi:hypothetical protein